MHMISTNSGEEINKKYEDIKASMFADSSTNMKETANVAHTNPPHNNLSKEITHEEIYEAIKHQKSVKSFDPDQLHPNMIKRLPPTVINILHKIFNLCLTQGIWVWDSSNVIFLKKVGKSNYMKAGSYRPITMASFVGKLLERILERRLRQHCEFYDLLDDEQEGFRAGRNTTRYLYKLVANLKEAQRKKFTTFLLCLDFEKAFDSVWLKGLIVKLHAWNINGKFLRLIIFLLI